VDTGAGGIPFADVDSRLLIVLGGFADRVETAALFATGQKILTIFLPSRTGTSKAFSTTTSPLGVVLRHVAVRRPCD